MTNRRSVLTALAVALTVPGALAQTAPAATLSLAQAQALALQHRPLLQAATASAAAAAEVAPQLRSVYFPLLAADFTGAGAEPNSRIAAGTLNNPIIFGRYANGLSASELITDFGPQ